MTKIRETKKSRERAEQAAARAAAEVLGVPVKVGEPWSSLPELKVSGRDAVVRRYAYHVYRVETHPDCTAALGGPGLLWCDVETVFRESFEPPFSHTSLDILSQLIAEGRLQGRTQLTSVVILRREKGKGEKRRREFLLRWNVDWGFALPTKRRESDKPLDVARRIAEEELGLRPGKDVRLSSARILTFTTHGVSSSAEMTTYYVHSLFDASMKTNRAPESPESDLPLVWATEEQIRDGLVPVDGMTLKAGQAQPGRVSPTAFQILSALDYVKWIEL
jgi:hypothetical protein